MSRIVMKFGGTSLGDPERMRHAAGHVAREVAEGHGVAVVVSAMGGETDRLVERLREFSAAPNTPESDMVLAAGEQISAGLFALALEEQGIRGRAWLGWQVPVTTGDDHGAAHITRINADRLGAAIDSHETAVVAGFQGISHRDRVTTLGRGGSDVSAVALAAALGAHRCDIYTDVNGVFTANPHIVARAQRLDRITFEEMLEMASVGTKVLQARAVALALAYDVRVRVRCAFDAPDAPQGDPAGVGRPGTLVCPEEEIMESMESRIVSGVAYSPGEAKLTLLGVADRPGVAAAIFSPLADAGVNVDMIVQNISHHTGHTDVTFTVEREALARARALVEAGREGIGYASLVVSDTVAKVSVIGMGMRTHAGVARTMFRTLAHEGINIQAISTSEIKISVLIDARYAELAVRALHTAYGLDADSSPAA